MTAPLVTGARLGDYQLVRPVGQGGFGQVWQAEDPHGARVAIKILKPALGTTLDPYRGWFHREYLTGKRVDSRFIAAPIDADLHSEPSWIAFPYIEGRTLRNLVESGPLAPDRAAQIAVQILRGLTDLHAAGLVHRDIKPANIMISPGDRVTILDLGIVHDPSATKVTTLVQPGTPAYLAPEAVQGLTAGPAVDIWAFALTVSDMLCPQRRHTGEHPIQAVRRVYPRWADIMQACLVSEPDRRPAASQVIEWINEPRLPVHRPIPPAHDAQHRPPGPPTDPRPTVTSTTGGEVPSGSIFRRPAWAVGAAAIGSSLLSVAILTAYGAGPGAPVNAGWVSPTASAEPTLGSGGSPTVPVATATVTAVPEPTATVTVTAEPTATVTAAPSPSPDFVNHRYPVSWSDGVTVHSETSRDSDALEWLPYQTVVHVVCRTQGEAAVTKTGKITRWWDWIDYPVTGYITDARINTGGYPPEVPLC